jgi:hypothetical protein
MLSYTLAALIFQVSIAVLIASLMLCGAILKRVKALGAALIIVMALLSATGAICAFLSVPAPTSVYTIVEGLRVAYLAMFAGWLLVPLGDRDMAGEPTTTLPVEADTGSENAHTLE